MSGTNYFGFNEASAFRRGNRFNTRDVSVEVYRLQ